MKAIKLLPESLGALRSKVITIYIAHVKIMRSTFKILFYINKSKTKADGTTAILCRITIDGANAVITTGESTTPHDWSVKRGETTDKKTNQRLQTFREEIEQGYNTLLYKYGAVSAELLKNHLQGIGRTPTTLFALSTEELKAQRESKSEGTYSNNRSSDRQIKSFMRSRGEEDIPLRALTIDFFDDYHFHLKKEGYAPATINGHLCWLSRLMYRAVSQGTIRFNPFEEAKYEAVERKPRFLSKGDVAKLLAFPLQDEGAELSRRMFLFSVFTGLAFVDLQSLRASQIEMNSEGKRYIRKTKQKTEVESLIPLHPIAEQILWLYTNEKSKGDYKIFPDTMSKEKLLTHLKAVELACDIRTLLGYHVGRHSFGTLTLEAGIPIESIAKMMGYSSIASTKSTLKSPTKRFQEIWRS